MEETWEIVNDSFLDTGRRRWTPQTRQRKREDILSSSIQSRAKARDIIRRMLASLGDPYTWFLSPSEFSKIGRYDVSGIGINLREIPYDNGEVKLKVPGLLLDGPAHSAGVRQVASALHDNCRSVLVGERTFGKGLIQSVFELHDGSGVVVIVRKYVTPNHMDVNGNGIEPDYQNFPGWSDVKQHLSECNKHWQGES